MGDDKYWFYDIMFNCYYLRYAPKTLAGDRVYNIFIEKLKNYHNTNRKIFVNTYHPKLTRRQEKQLENYRDYPQYYKIP